MARRIPESRSLKTKADVLRELGGDYAVAALTGAEYKTVEGWKRADRFPASYFLVMTFALYQKGLTAPPELWGQVTPTQRKQALSALIAQHRRGVAA